MSAPGKAQIKLNADPGLAPTGRDPKVRTLKEPPDIWDLVHETRAEFNPGSAFVGHLTSLHPLVLAAILLIIGGGAVFWFMTLRGGSASQTAAPPVPAESSNTRTVLSPQSTDSNRTAPSSDQQSNIAPAPGDTAGSTIDKPKTDIAAPAAPSDIAVPTKPLRQNPTSLNTARRETATGTRNKEGVRAASLTADRSATVGRTDNNDGSQASITPGPKSDKEKAANPTGAKKEADKALSPQLIAPAKAGPTPKAKVIPWP